MSLPRAACEKLTGSCKMTSSPSRVNCACSFSSINTRQSPEGPLEGPLRPDRAGECNYLPELQLVCARSDAFDRARGPSPSQSLQRAETVLPSPPQVGQAVTVIDWPKSVRATRCTCPTPQVEQDSFALREPHRSHCTFHTPPNE